MRYPAWKCAFACAIGLLAPSARAQVVDFSKYPDFAGQWDRTGPPNNWQLRGPAPLTPEYQKVYDASKADQRAGKPGNWPSTFCVPEGMPAMMNMYNPMEIIITPETTYLLTSHNNDIYRRIYTDGRDWPADPERTLAGYSIGRWVDAPATASTARSRSRPDSCGGRAPTKFQAFPSTRTTRPSSRNGFISTKPTATRSMTISP